MSVGDHPGASRNAIANQCPSVDLAQTSVEDPSTEDLTDSPRCWHSMVTVSFSYSRPSSDPFEEGPVRRDTKQSPVPSAPQVRLTLAVMAGG
jgi:hypothetical protein